MAVNNNDQTRESVLHGRTTGGGSTPVPTTNMQAPYGEAGKNAAPKKEYSYPRGMLIAAFVLGIVGTSLAVIALIVGLMSGGGGSGRGGMNRSMDRSSERITEQVTERDGLTGQSERLLELDSEIQTDSQSS